MKFIIVSTRWDALQARLEALSPPPPVCLLGEPPDGSQTRGPFFASHCPPLEERLRIQDEYIEAISELGELNENSTAWLAHPISARNDLEPYPLFLQIIDFLNFRKAWDRVEFGPLPVYAPRKAQLTNILEFARRSGIGYETPGLRTKRPTLLRNFKKAITRLREELKYFRKFRSYSKRARPFAEGLNPGARYTLIRTWFDGRSADEIGRARDIFLGILPSRLEADGRSILYYGGVIDIDRSLDEVLDQLEPLRNEAAILPEMALLTFTDRVAIFLFSLTIGLRITVPETFVIDGQDVSIVLRNYLRKRYPMTKMRRDYAGALALRRLLDRLSIEGVFTMFENSSWLKLLIREMRKRNPPVPVTAFQHAQIALCSTRLFPGRAEFRRGLLPDRIVTLGRYTYRFLVERGNYPRELMRIGCALRQEVIPRELPVRSGIHRILACLWTRSRSVDLIRFLDQAGLGKEGYEVRLRPHPVQPLSRIQKDFDFPITERFNISEGSLADDLSECDVVVYSGTTACLDALAAGRPVVNVEFEDFISPDPLFEISTFKWEISAPDQLAGVLREIESLSDEEFDRRRSLALRFVEDYFFPVTDENLRAFDEREA